MYLNNYAISFETKYWFTGIFLIFVYHKSCNAQETTSINHKTFYFAVGPNLSYYSKSDIHVESSGLQPFNFTLKDVSGTDDKGLNFSNGAPQYSIQIGYYNHKKKWGIEFNFDHIKYFARQNQRVSLIGTINKTYYNTDTLLTPQFFQLEHSDGANYALLKLVKWLPLLQSNQGNVLNLALKGGVGPVIPKTNTIIMGKHWDNRYHIAGYVIALEAGVRYNFLKNLYAEGNAKAAYANYTNFLIEEGSGSQAWRAVHFSMLIGFQF